MCNLFGIGCILYSIVQSIKESTEKPVPQETYFDWDAYWEDVRNGMTSVEQIKKRKSGGYLTTIPKSSE